MNSKTTKAQEEKEMPKYFFRQMEDGKRTVVAGDTEVNRKKYGHEAS